MKKSFQRLIQKTEAAKGQLRFKNFNIQIKGVDESKNQIRAVFSTGAVDRHGEIVDQKGWDLTEFKKNPVVLFAHDHSKAAIGQVVEIGLNAEGNLEGVIQFAVEENPEAKVIFQLYKGRYMRALSAGFINDEYVVDQQNETVTLTKNRLLEESCVNVPANSEALAKGLTDGSVKEATEDDEPAILEIAAEVKEACGDNPTSILAVIRALTGALKATQEADKAVAEPEGEVKVEAGAKVEHPVAKANGGNKRIPVNVLNRAIRELLAVKKNY